MGWIALPRPFYMPTPGSHRSVAALTLSRSWHSHGTWTLYSVVKVPEGIPPHLFPVGEAVFGGVFRKIHNFFTYSPAKDLFEWVWKVPSIDRQREARFLPLFWIILHLFPLGEVVWGVILKKFFIPSKSSQRERAKSAAWMKFLFFLSLVPTERGQKLCLFRSFLPSRGRSRERLKIKPFEKIFFFPQ